MAQEDVFKKLVSHCKEYGFVFPSSDIYDGLGAVYDYGQMGVELKNNIKQYWWQSMVLLHENIVGIDSAIFMHPTIWKASGHVDAFNDPLIDNRDSKKRYRADVLIEDQLAKYDDKINKEVAKAAKRFGEAFDEAQFRSTNGRVLEHQAKRDALHERFAKALNDNNLDELRQIILDEEIVCPISGTKNWTEVRQFNLMFKTFQGVTEDAKNTVYLRPETAQGIFTNFVNTQRTTRRKLPFGVCQIGKSFRNEITPGNFIFRVREFEQMELEFFCKPGTDLEWFQYWRTFCHNWLLGIGLKDENLRLRDHDPEELCFYSKATTDFEFLFPFGWGELWGVADRTDYDLTQHQNTSGVKMVYREGEGKDMVEYVPYVIEPSLGVERSVLAVLCDAYDEEVVGQDKKGNDDVRVVLHFHPALAPFKAAILPLSKKDVLAGPAMELYNELSKEFMVDYDETGSIGKRYRREDEIGTPFCITVDFDTVGDEAKGIAADNCVTVRDRDTMEQVRMPISELKSYIESKIEF